MQQQLRPISPSPPRNTMRTDRSIARGRYHRPRAEPALRSMRRIRPVGTRLEADEHGAARAEDPPVADQGAEALRRRPAALARRGRGARTASSHCAWARSTTWVITDADVARTMLVTDAASWMRPPATGRSDSHRRRREPLHPVRQGRGHCCSRSSRPRSGSKALEARSSAIDAIIDGRGAGDSHRMRRSTSSSRWVGSRSILAAWVLLGERLDRDSRPRSRTISARSSDGSATGSASSPASSRSRSAHAGER